MNPGCMVKHFYCFFDFIFKCQILLLNSHTSNFKYYLCCYATRIIISIPVAKGIPVLRLQIKKHLSPQAQDFPYNGWMLWPLSYRAIHLCSQTHHYLYKSKLSQRHQIFLSLCCSKTMKYSYWFMTNLDMKITGFAWDKSFVMYAKIATSEIPMDMISIAHEMTCNQLFTFVW